MAKGTPLTGAALQRHNERLQRELEELRRNAPQHPTPRAERRPEPSRAATPAKPEQASHQHTWALLDPRRSRRMERAYRAGHRRVCVECGELE